MRRARGRMTVSVVDHGLTKEAAVPEADIYLTVARKPAFTSPIPSEEKLPMHIKTTTDALKILTHMAGNDPARQKQFEEEFANREIASQIYSLRRKAGLSQAALARRVRTQQSVISRLEDADYEGHSLAMLNRIAAALKQRVEIRFVPRSRTRRPKAA
jgi:ribosome-binding protein aMBF1 (putative translation factor)